MATYNIGHRTFPHRNPLRLGTAPERCLVDTNARQPSIDARIYGYDDLRWLLPLPKSCWQ
jgi:hypothetical protein